MTEEISKSQKKREATALQELGVRLMELPAATLDGFPLPDVLRQAIDSAKLMKSYGARRRQAQLIGKLMRQANHEEIAAAFQQLAEEQNAKTAQFHELEQWRERLINDKTALTEFIDCFNPEDVQQLRQLIKKAVTEKAGGHDGGAAKALFRFLRKCASC